MFRTLISCAALSLLPALLSIAHAGGSLQPYRSEAEFQQVLQRWQAQARQRLAEVRRASANGLAMQAAPAAVPAPASALKAEASADRAAGAAESITNVQTAGVDEGGIVKRVGDHLVVLRRGRLFTVRIGGDRLQPVAMLDAYAPGADPAGAWYDELLVRGSTVVVVGYSYARGGTEIGLFDIGHDGSLAYRATYHLRSTDYYASRNYASRLIGSKLVFYAPALLQPWGPNPLQAMPALRRWQATLPGDFERILPATRIYRTDDEFDPNEALALHTVTSCDLAAQPLRCESTAVLGPPGRTFYVSPGSVYVWTNAWRRRAPNARDEDAGPRSAVFRLPLEGDAAPTALKTAGVPIDQMSFLEDDTGHLNVLLRAEGPGESMWGAQRSRGALALLRVPLTSFGSGREAAQLQHYRRVPGSDAGALQNRYVGDWLLWGGADGAWALRFASSGTAASELQPGHAVERIEAMGAHAVLVGNDGADLRFSAVRLGRGEARLAGRYVFAGASQGETRSHGFFYRGNDPDSGLLGLPVVGGGRSRPGAVYAGAGGAASVVFLRQRSLQFTGLGELRSSGARRDDGCKASCVDWYGNARPIFIGERLFALMGYELVEGRLSGGRESDEIEERRRVNFAPAVRGRGDRATPFE